MTEPTPVSATGPILDETEAQLPPMPPGHLAAYRRMAREPHVFDGYEDGMWVSFSGETIVAAGHDHDAVIRAAEEAGESDPLIVPMLAEPFIG